MLFVAAGIDKPQNLDRRKENRRAHLNYLNGLGACVKVAGALLAADQETPIGSMLILEGENEDEIQALLAKDPYKLADLFERVEVRPWRQAVGQPLT